MIIGNISNMNAIQLPDSIKSVIEQVIEKTNIPLENDVYDIDGRDIYFVKMSACNRPFKEAKQEIHQKYIDVHLVLDGEESIGFSNDKLVIDEDFLEEKDIAFGMTDSESFFSLKKGEFAVFFPNECHKPLCSQSNETALSEVTKTVIKILV